MADKKLDDIRPDWKTDWHAAFYDAVRAELRDYRDALDIRPEVPPADKPQRMDVLIIKQTKDVALGGSFAEDFKALNIVEYKSPEDSFAIPDFYKILGYAGNLSYLSDPFAASEDMTAAVVVTQKPVKLFKFLRGAGLEAAASGEGFYRIKAGFPVPDIKVVESKLLDKGDYPWLANLSDNVAAEALGALLLESRAVGVPTRSYFHALAQANPDAIKEVRMMDSAALDKVLDEIGYVSREELEEERKLREEERKLLEEKLNAREEERKLLEEELKALEEGRKKSVAGLYGMGVAPEAISAALGMTFSEVVANLLECLAAQPKDSGQGS